MSQQCDQLVLLDDEMPVGVRSQRLLRWLGGKVVAKQRESTAKIAATNAVTSLENRQGLACILDHLGLHRFYCL